jgi:hypothetical protein
VSAQRHVQEEGKGSPGKRVLDSLRSLLDEAQDLIELGREQVQSRQNPSVRSKVIPELDTSRNQTKDETEISYNSTFALVFATRWVPTYCFMTSW